MTESIQYIDTENFRFGYLESPSVDSPHPPLVMVHGYPGRPQDFRFLFPHARFSMYCSGDAQLRYIDHKDRHIHHHHCRSRKCHHRVFRCDGYLGVYINGTFNGWTNGSIRHLQSPKSNQGTHHHIWSWCSRIQGFSNFPNQDGAIN